MDLIHMFLNLVAPPFTFFTLLFLLPPFQILKFFLSTIRTVFSEDVAGKVVLVTGASSGIGEKLAYEYAKRGACLALCARRENSLQEVARTALNLGSPEVIAFHADVAKIDDCKRFVEEAVKHFGRLDHVVNNAGVSQVATIEETDDITNLRPIMDINFWGSIYTTRYAIPHLRNTGGKIIVLSSASSWLPTPRMSVYNASKAAVSAFFETMRIELGPEIHITLVTPGYIESEMTQGKFIGREGIEVVDQDMRDVQIGLIPMARTEACAKAIVNSACRGERYLTEPAWFRVTYFWKMFCPEVLEWGFRIFHLASQGESAKESPIKKILDISGANKVLYPDTIHNPQIKTD